VSIQTVIGVGAALLLSQKGLRLKRGWESLFILPWAIPEMIGAQMWFNIFAPTTGWLSLAAQTFGKDFPLGFLMGWEKSSSMPLLVLLIAGVWYGFPFMLLAASAGLKLLPGEVYDAARIDGANAWQIFKDVTWPLLKPLLLPAIIIRGVFAFNQFYLFQAFRVNGGSLANISYILFNPNNLNNQGGGQFAVSAALNIITMLILVGFVMTFNRLGRLEQRAGHA
jgi:arabinogalactan oligomer/maltooligosaccharide transport system permease protein